MKTLRAWTRRLGGLFGKQRREAEIADEIQSHLEMHIADNLRAGMTAQQARREALLRLGGVEPVIEACRERSTAPSKAPRSSVSASIPKPGVEDGSGTSSKWSSAMEPSGSGTWLTST